MNNYGNPMVTYNEIVEALRAILECAKTNGYLDDYSFLNARYDAIEKGPLHEEQEQALIQAIQSLEKTIDAADKVIRENLKSVLDEIIASNIFVIPTKYKVNEEYRKLAAQDEFIAKLQEMSLPVAVLSEVPKEEENVETIDSLEELTNPFEEVEVESLDVSTLDDSPEEKIETYYSRVKLGNVKNAFAITEEQYEKLKQYGIENVEKEPVLETVKEEEEKEEIPEIDLSLLTPEIPKEEISTSSEIENVGETTLTTKELPKENVVLEEEFTTKEIPKEKEVVPTEEGLDAKKEEPTSEVAKVEEKKEEISNSSEQKKAAVNRIQLIKKALGKAKEKENGQLVQILEQQLRKEVESLKS